MLRVVTPATQEPITLDKVKTRLRIDDDSFDAVLPDMITAARELVEIQSGCALAAAAWLWVPYEAPVPKVSRIPLGPIASITEVTYADSDGIRQTIAADGYVADLDRSTITINDPDCDWTSLNVKFTVAPTNIPGALLAAIVLLVGDQIANTEANVEKPLTANPAVQDMIFTYRRVLP